MNILKTWKNIKANKHLIRNIIQGKPVIYGGIFAGPLILHNTKNAIIENNYFTGEQDQYQCPNCKYTIYIGTPNE